MLQYTRACLVQCITLIISRHSICKLIMKSYTCIYVLLYYVRHVTIATYRHYTDLLQTL